MDFILLVIAISIISYVWRNAYIGRFSTMDDTWRLRQATTKRVSKQQRKTNRHKALQKAKAFLKPYKELMGEHCLANENCKVNLVIDNGEKKIICINKRITDKNQRKLFTAKIAKDFTEIYTYTVDYVVDNLWDILCDNFSYTTVYENIFSALSAGMLDIKESSIIVKNNNNQIQQIYDSVSNTHIRTNNLLNINTATEAELTSLPGVNVVIAKKAVKHIEKTGGFTSIEEFIYKMKIKEIFEEKIKEMAYVDVNAIENPSHQKPQNEQNQIPQIETKQNNGNTLDLLDMQETKPYIPHSQNERIIDL